jgi:hypothetical protein
MMLKFGVGILLLLNAGLLAWQWGLIAPWGLDPHGHREPSRLAQQIQPETLTVTPLSAQVTAGQTSEALPVSPPVDSDASAAPPSSQP